MTYHPMPRSFLRAWIVLLVPPVVLSLPACSDGRKKCYPAQGRILYKGQPLAGAEVWLIPTGSELLQTNPPVRPFGKTGQTGEFTLMTYVAGDGAPVGEYQARIICERKVKNAKPGDDDDEETGVQNILPARYADPDKSNLKVHIKAGNNVLEDFNLKP